MCADRYFKTKKLKSRTAKYYAITVKGMLFCTFTGEIKPDVIIHVFPHKKKLIRTTRMRSNVFSSHSNLPSVAIFQNWNLCKNPPHFQILTNVNEIYTNPMKRKINKYITFKLSKCFENNLILSCSRNLGTVIIFMLLLSM